MALLQPSFVGCDSPGGGGGTSQNNFNYEFNLHSRVRGVTYFSIGEVPSSVAAVLVARAGTLSSVTLTVNQPGSVDYSLDVLVDGVITETVDLISPATEVFSVSLTGAVASGSEIALTLKPKTGSTPSSFSRAVAVIEILES